MTGVSDYINTNKLNLYAECCIFYVFELLNNLFYILQINTMFSLHQRELTKSILHKGVSKQFKMEIPLITAVFPKEVSDCFSKDIY